jgi:hypothetical protein
MTQQNRALFSIHTTAQGSVAIYLEEQDAIKDLLEDVVGQTEILDLDELQATGRESVKTEGHFERLDNARDAFAELAIKVAHLSREEALDLAADIIRAIKFHDVMTEKENTFTGLKAVK